MNYMKFNEYELLNHDHTYPFTFMTHSELPIIEHCQSFVFVVIAASYLAFDHVFNRIKDV